MSKYVASKESVDSSLLLWDIRSTQTSMLPIIKGAAKIATPHAKGFLSDLGKEGINQGIKGLTNFNQKRKRDNLDNE